MRGTKDVDEEYADILEKAELAKQITNPWTLLLFHKKYRQVHRASKGSPQLALLLRETCFQVPVKRHFTV